MTQFVATAASPDFHIRFPTAVVEIVFKGAFVLAHIASHALTALTVPRAQASSSDRACRLPACPFGLVKKNGRHRHTPKLGQSDGMTPPPARVHQASMSTLKPQRDTMLCVCYSLTLLNSY